ncbi:MULTISPECIES: hypothetical protein [unclassified Wolbachia]|uniref:hypothetical protein n=1 Tax=unclassified Wolbachia TaxID=2640676 RepID=UPI000B2D771F|nr:MULTISPECIES: hypothetical protein [unclassified Wolbachia]
MLDPSSQGTGMTGEGTSLTTVIPLRVSAAAVWCRKISYIANLYHALKLLNRS